MTTRDNRGGDAAEEDWTLTYRINRDQPCDVKTGDGRLARPPEL